MSWYNKYRPQSFGDVVGQSLVKSVLENALAKNFIKQAYLFSGTRGVGKTTLARIFANQLNQTSQNPEAKIDIIELDAASNTGIDNIRQLIENSTIPPLSGKYKIYIIDEVHMLSKSAMSALLKTLEEPPSHVVFLLATTNPEKLLPTVLSRLTKLPLSNHSVTDITSRLQFIAENEEVKINTSSLELIAKRAEGSQRDAINLLETVASYNLQEFKLQNTSEILGLVSETLLMEVADRIASQNLDPEFLQKLSQINFDPETFLGQFLEFLLDKSMLGNADYNSLIPTVAEVLSWKLPITSINQAVALVQANFSQKGVVVVKKNPEQIAKKITEKESPKILADPVEVPKPEPQKPKEAIEKSEPVEMQSVPSKVEKSEPKIEAKSEVKSKHNLNVIFQKILNSPQSSNHSQNAQSRPEAR